MIDPEEFAYEMQRILREGEQKIMASLECQRRTLEKIKRGEWEYDDEYSSSQSSNHYSKSDYYKNKW